MMQRVVSSLYIYIGPCVQAPQKSRWSARACRHETGGRGRGEAVRREKACARLNLMSWLRGDRFSGA